MSLSLGQVSQCYRQAALGLAVQWEDALPWLLRRWALCCWARRRYLKQAAGFLKPYSEQSLHVLAQIKHEVSKGSEAGVQLSASMPIQTFHCAGYVSDSSLIKLAKCSSPKWVLYCQTSWKPSNSTSPLFLKYNICLSLLGFLQMLMRDIFLRIKRSSPATRDGQYLYVWCVNTYWKAKLHIRHTNDKIIKVELAVTYWECITLCLENVCAITLLQLRPGIHQ